MKSPAAPSRRAASAPSRSDPFLASLYERLHDTPMQRKLRALRPWPNGVVFIQRPGMTHEDIRGHFRLMKQLGFTCLKQCELRAGENWRAVYHLALDEGLIPFWYDEACFEEPTPGLLKKLGLPTEIAAAELRMNPVWRQRQIRLIRRRIDRPTAPRIMVNSHETDGLPGTLKRDEFGVPPEAAKLFTDWLKARYGTVAGLKSAWNFGHTLVRTAGWKTWAEVRRGVVAFVNAEKQDYRRIVDVYRFRADMHLAKIGRMRDAQTGRDPSVPVRAGGEMSLFLPFAARATDMEGIAGQMAVAGSFYPSMHPGWHYEEADFEFTLPTYLQASLAVDWFKGGWAATWESTGGPQQLSGGKAPFVPEARDKIAGFTLDENTIQQLMLTWVGAGFRGFGQWCWNARSFGWEAGEYALLDRNQQPCARTFAAGRIATACTRLRDELWTARKEPIVGVFQDWESDAFWAAVAVGGRDMYKGFPVRARIGAGRALTEANVPWEHVTARNLRAGLADRYAAIYLPAQLAVDAGLLELLCGYVERGGRVVLDAPGAWYGYDGALLPTADGSTFERLFGCGIGDYQFSRANHVVHRVAGHALAGFVLDLQPTRARAVEKFADGRPAVTEHRLGRGTAVVIGYAAALGCHVSGDAWLQARLVKHVLGKLRPAYAYACAGAMVYRLAAPTADHYFLINPGGTARRVRLDVREQRYRRWEDPVAATTLRRGETLALPANGARWVRALK